MTGQDRLLLKKAVDAKLREKLAGEIPPADYKECSACGVWKPSSVYSKGAQCNTCKAEKKRERRRVLKEQKEARLQEPVVYLSAQELNAIKNRERCRKWYAKNAEYKREYHRKRREAAAA